MGILRSVLRSVVQPNAAGAWPPGHFYSPIPEVKELPTIPPEKPGRLAGVDLHDSEQVALLQSLGKYVIDLPETRVAGRRYYWRNAQFGQMDAAVLSSMIGMMRPKKIIEVGSGHSSCLILDALEAHEVDAEITFIEPYPDRLKENLNPGDLDRATLIESPVQSVDVDRLTALDAGDLLFIDSSHVSKYASDVNYLILEVLPVLRPGVQVHIHDIFFPFEYPREWLSDGRFWNEAYLLRSFLAFNHAFRIRLFNDYVWRYHRAALDEALPVASQHSGSSLWIERA